MIPLPSSSLPLSPSSSTGLIPKKGSVAEPGLVGMAPGKGEIMIPPVSVCHQVSTIGHRSLPTFTWYHRQASGLMGSPTVPRSCSVGMGWRAGQASPSRASARMAVGAV